MKILAIRIKNLASLEGITEIDFTKEPLLSAGIFAITGQTGAGKSTLLDALCLALYAKTPRYIQARESGVELDDVKGDKIGQGDVRGILRDGTADGYAWVDFVGIDGRPYSAKWLVRRAKNKIDGSLQAETVELTNLSTNIPIGGTKTEKLKEIERLVGLNFEQFTRSVLLAQGDFTAFLKADKNEKSSLLEKLTGTDIYSDISSLIFDKFKQASREVDDLKLQLSGINILSDEEQSIMLTNNNVLKEQIVLLNDKLLKLTQEIEWHKVLTGLITDKDNAQSEYEVAINKKEDAKDRILLLHQVEAVQPVRSLKDGKNITTKQLSDKTVEIEINSIKLKDLKLQLNDITLQYEASEKRLNTKQQERIDAQPTIDKAKELDTLLKEISKQTKELEQEFKTAENKKEQHLLLIKNKEEEAGGLSNKIVLLEKWKKENISRQPIAENIDIIKSKLEDAGRILLEQIKIKEQHDTLNGALKKSEEIITDLTPNIELQEKNKSAIEKIYLKNNIAVNAIAIDELKVSEEQLNTDIAETIRATAHWKLLYQVQSDQKINTDKLRNYKVEIENKQTQSIQLQNELNIAFAKQELSEKQLTRARLQTADNVESLRAQLVEGEECFVCGSKHHPYSQDNPQLRLVLDGLEKEYKECSQIYTQLLSDNTVLLQEIKVLEKDIPTLEKEIENNNKNIHSLQEQWMSFKIDSTIYDIDDDQKNEWLETNQLTLTTQLKSIKESINYYDKLKKQVEKERANLDSLDKDLHKNLTALNNAVSNKNSFVDQLNLLSNQLITSETELIKITSLLNEYFSKENWLDKWKEDNHNFLQSIKEFSDNWKSKLKDLEDSNNVLIITQNNLSGLQKQLIDYDKDLIDKQQKYATFSNALLEKEKDRKSLFDGKDISLVEQAFQQETDAATNDLKTIADTKESINNEVIKSETNKVQFEKDILAFNKTIKEYREKIAVWIADYNTPSNSLLNEDILDSLLTHSTEWIDAERKSITALQEVITKTEATLAERTLKLSEHEQKKYSDSTIEELTEQLNPLQSELNSLNKEHTETGYKLRQNEEHKNKAGGLLAKIEAKNIVYEQWDKLNDLLGSADGKKFKLIAQEYTLDVLLLSANEHLQHLTERYKLLRIPNSLGLQVLDKDMGDEKRTVYSLSGGESFLVSLALALGLASLSSNKMRVESLFIDEGFGSLDPATLIVAMEALDRLHNQGRKVGVISHVQEMTERIFTQIKVSRYANGKSKVEVIG